MLDVRKIIQLSLVAIVVSALLAMFVVSKSSAYDPLGRACRGAAANSAACQNRTNNNPLTGPDGLITRITRIVAALVGVASVIMIILGGYTYITSSGDPQKTKAAKDTILFAIIGLVIAATAGLIIGFILSKL